LGKGKVSVMDLKKMLDNYEIPKQLSTAIADGLYLLKVEY